MTDRAQAPRTVQPVARTSRRSGRAASVRVARLLRGVQARFASSLTRRIVVLNLGGLVALLGGFLYLSQYQKNLIDARLESLETQGKIIAQVMADSASQEDAEDFPASLEEAPNRPPQTRQGQVDARHVAAPGFSLNPERIGPLLFKFVKVIDTRARVYDRAGDLLVDSQALIENAKRAVAAGLGEDASAPAQKAPEKPTAFEELMATLRRWMRPQLDTYEDIGPKGNGKAYDEVKMVLTGDATALERSIRTNAKGETIVLIAVPIQGRQRLGALMLTTLGGQIDRIISYERWAIIRTFLVSAGVMALLSLLFANAIAEPMRRLAEAADRVRRGVKSRQEIPDFSDRQDEIGHLSGALRDMTRALYNRIEGIEHFAADVAHELKNPLTSLRSAVETLPIAKTDAARDRLLEIVKHDVARLDRLISDISDASRLDAELARAVMIPLDLSAVLEAVVDIGNAVERTERVSIEFIKQDPIGEGARGGWRVLGHDSRLAQVFDNIIDNARSFSPAGGRVRVLLRPESGIDMSGYRRDGYEILVDDNGPGIPQGACERVFERFYTDRPDQGFGNNSGLGLSISRQIVEAHGGRIRAFNRTKLHPEGTDEPANSSGAAESDCVLGARFALWFKAHP
jgi:two-component system, OmpR family, sensor histidine kinase ChvG